MGEFYGIVLAIVVIAAILIHTLIESYYEDKTLEMNYQKIKNTITNGVLSVIGDLVQTTIAVDSIFKVEVRKGAKLDDEFTFDRVVIRYDNGTAPDIINCLSFVDAADVEMNLIRRITEAKKNKTPYITLVIHKKTRFSIEKVVEEIKKAKS